MKRFLFGLVVGWLSNHLLVETRYDLLIRIDQKYGEKHPFTVIAGHLL